MTQKGRKAKRKATGFVKFIRIILILIMIGCIAFIGKRLYDYNTTKQNTAYIDNIVNEAKEKAKKELSKNVDSFTAREKQNLKVLNDLKEVNSDVIAYIEIPGTYVNYPILKGPDNDFYLRKDINKNYDIAGSLFVDINNHDDFDDDNTVIYGHHLEIDAMFTVLDGYRKQDFAQTHRQIFITTEEGLKEYEVFAVHAIPSTYDYRTLQFGDSEDKVPYFEKFVNNSEVTLKNDDFLTTDKIITLSTCQYDYNDQRLAIHARRVR